MPDLEEPIDHPAGPRARERRLILVGTAVDTDQDVQAVCNKSTVADDQLVARAKKANVKKLLIGHFSSKYDRLEEFEQEAREVFLNTELALEGVTYKI